MKRYLFHRHLWCLTACFTLWGCGSTPPPSADERGSATNPPLARHELPLAATGSTKESEFDGDAPDEDYVWVDGGEFEDGSVSKGFYRLRVRTGRAWVPAAIVNGVWVASYWRFSEPATAGRVFIRGHRGPDGYWVPGYWRREARAGYRWVATKRMDGHRIHGHWVPVNPKPGRTWVHGHWGRHDRWAPGHWRLASRSGHSWIRGHWHYGRWLHGHWRPGKKRANHLWVRGYRNGKKWVAGRWRIGTKAGFHWRRGYRGPKGWVASAWKKGRRPIAKRRYRIVRTRHMHQRRAKNRTKWRRGDAQRKHGKKQVRRGKKMTAVGKATGNKALQKRGKKKKKKGKKNVRKGKRKKRRARR